MWTLVSLVVSSLVGYDVSYFSRGCLFSEILKIPNWKLKCKQHVQKRHFHALALLQILNFFHGAFDGCRFPIWCLIGPLDIREHRTVHDAYQKTNKGVIHVDLGFEARRRTSRFGHFWILELVLWAFLKVQLSLLRYRNNSREKALSDVRLNPNYTP